MAEIEKRDHICQYNDRIGQETLHPLVSVIDFSKVAGIKRARMSYGFYAVFLIEVICGDLQYGSNYYDYQEGTVVFTGQGQVVGASHVGAVLKPKGRERMFPTDLIRRTTLGSTIQKYDIFH